MTRSAIRPLNLAAQSAVVDWLVIVDYPGCSSKPPTDVTGKFVTMFVTIDNHPHAL